MENIKTLIVGAGVAGLTCAALLRKHGISPKIAERQPEDKFNTSGYMLGMLPLGGRVLNELDLHQQYLDRSTSMEKYRVHSTNGKMLKSYPLDFIHQHYGPYRGISRVELINLLLDKAGKENIQFNTTITGLHVNDKASEVTFSDGNVEQYNLVIIADGLNSHTRPLLINKNEYHYKKTGWGGWVTWQNNGSHHTYDEYWGAGKFIGFYPVKDKTGIFIGGPLNKIKNKDSKEFVSQLASELPKRDEQTEEAFEALKKEESPFFWEFEDVRSDTWYKGNAVLLGDAATGFLPTAGVGASMAMDSAAALADEISRADADHITYALKLYTQRQKPKVEKAQSDSRKLGNLMFVKNAFPAYLRNQMIPFYSIQSMLSDLMKVMEGK